VSRYRGTPLPNVWPVVADFFLAVLAVLVFVEARAGRPEPALPQKLRAIQEGLAPLVRSGTVKEARVEYPEARIVLSDQYLTFPPCRWELTAEKAEQVRQVLDPFSSVKEYISAIAIEGHADKRKPIGCPGLSFGTNFELSQKRALSVYAALLNVSIDMLDDAESSDTPHTGVVWALRGQHKVLVAGYGDTRPWPGVADKFSEAHRRVEIKFSFCRKPTDPGCSNSK
jgi:outer membrane protein OmpA-like peptidoglycan-associated protein